MPLALIVSVLSKTTPPLTRLVPLLVISNFVSSSLVVYSFPSIVIVLPDTCVVVVIVPPSAIVICVLLSLSTTFALSPLPSVTFPPFDIVTTPLPLPSILT